MCYDYYSFFDDYYYYYYDVENGEVVANVNRNGNVSYALDCVNGHVIVMNANDDDDDDVVDAEKKKKEESGVIATMYYSRHGNDGGVIVAGATPLNFPPAVSHHRTSPQCHPHWCVTWT